VQRKRAEIASFLWTEGENELVPLADSNSSSSREDKLKSTYSIRLGKSFANVFAIQMMKIRQLLYKSGSLPLNGAYLSNAIY